MPCIFRIGCSVSAISRSRWLRIPAELSGLVVFCYAWLVLASAARGIAQLGAEHRLIGIAASLTGLWIVLRASSLLLRDVLLARAVATIAWVVFAWTSWASWPQRRRHS